MKRSALRGLFLALATVLALGGLASAADGYEALRRTMVEKQVRQRGITRPDVLAAMEQDGLLKRVQQGRQWYVVGPESAPEPKGRSGTPHEEEEEEVYPDPVDDF